MRAILFAVIILACTGASCSDAARDVAKTGASIVIDCTAGEIGKTAGELAPMAEKIVLDAIDASGKVDWAPVKEYGKGLGTNVGKCVLAEGIARVLAPKPADPNAAHVAGLHIDVDATRAGFEELKRELFGPVTFRTSGGEL